MTLPSNLITFYLKGTHVGGDKKYKNSSHCSHCGFIDIMGLWGGAGFDYVSVCVFVCVGSTVIVTLTKLLSFT